MKKTALLVAAVLLVGFALAPATAGEKKTHEMTATIVSVDMNAKTITVKDEKGKETTSPVLDKAVESLKTLKAGEKVVLTCLDNEKGEHTGVTAIRPVKPGK